MPLLPGKQEVALQSPKRAGTRAHTFVGAHDPEMLKSSATLDLQRRTEGDTLVVSTAAENVGAGHNVPGSGPIRQVLLKVEAWDADGRMLSCVGGPDGLLHPLAGMGNPKTGARGPQHWGGMPGAAPVKVQARLVYRWAFIGLADAKGWKVEDRLMRAVVRQVDPT